jgi:hypothetical protein
MQLCRPDPGGFSWWFLVIGKDVLGPVTTRGDVIDGAGEFDMQRTGRARTLRQEEAKGKA